MHKGHDEPPSLWRESKTNRGGLESSGLGGGRGAAGDLSPVTQLSLVLCCPQPSSTVTFAELQIFPPDIRRKGTWGVGKGLWCFKSISYLFALF